jgi:uncharacterized membrane protein
MGPDENVSQPPTAADLAELRVRVDRLERELATLRQHGSPVAFEPPPMASPPPLAATTPPQAAPRLEPLPTASHAPMPARASLENRLGSQVFNRISIVALLIGTTLFLKLAIDNHWIGPLGRILIGLIAGSGIVVWSEVFRRQGVKAFSYSLKAVGSGVLYLSLWAAFQLYHLLPAPVALGAMILVTAWNAFMAWSQDAELLAAYALIGGFATPVLLSTGGNHEIFLFTYLFAINLATAVLIGLKSWPRLAIGTFPATVVYFIGWYSSSYIPAELGITSLFLVLFWLSFVSVSIGPVSLPPTIPSQRSPLASFIAGIFLPLSNAAFLSLGFYFILQDSQHHAMLPWLMLLLAAAYLGVMRLPQRRTASAVHLSLAVVFLTIAVPLKASGHWITVAWLVEGVALYWVATRLSTPSPGPTSLHEDTVLRWLASAALLLGFTAIFVTSYWFDVSFRASFFNHDLATALVGVAAFSAIAWLANRADIEERESLSSVVIALIAIDVIALLLSLREMAATRSAASIRTAFFNADFAMALVGIGVLAVVAYTARRISHLREPKQTWLLLAGSSTVAMNLVAILSGVQEIAALSRDGALNSNAGLKEALAVSTFLMAYSALLLAAGFWKRTAFIRWQGLILLVFTIAKTFLYDMSSLSQGYRVASFLGLGVLLMAVSFVYQKDWLSLREPAPSTQEKP